MSRSKAEDAGGLTPVKDDNEAAAHFTRRTLLFLNCFDYTAQRNSRNHEHARRDGFRNAQGLPSFRSWPRPLTGKL